MKFIINLIFLISISYSSYGQNTSFYQSIKKTEYDSIELKTWYKGRIFFNNGTQRDGWIHRNPNDPSVNYKETEKGKIISYYAIKTDGYYRIHENDTAFFVFMDINSRKGSEKKERALRILIDNDDGISLLRFSWLEKEESKIGKIFNSNVYEIHWRYFIWKDKKLNEIIYWNRDLYSILKLKLDSKEYYKKNRKYLKRDYHYTYLFNMIKIYNISNEQNAHMVEG